MKVSTSTQCLGFGLEADDRRKQWQPTTNNGPTEGPGGLVHHVMDHTLDGHVGHFPFRQANQTSISPVIFLQVNPASGRGVLMASITFHSVTQLEPWLLPLSRHHRTLALSSCISFLSLDFFDVPESHTALSE